MGTLCSDTGKRLAMLEYLHTSFMTHKLYGFLSVELAYLLQSLIILPDDIRTHHRQSFASLHLSGMYLDGKEHEV